MRQADPAFAGVEDGVFRHGPGVDAGGGGGDVFRCEQPGVVADGLLVGVAGFRDRALPGGVPHEAAAELEPLPVRVRGKERAVTVNARDPELVVRGGAFSGGVQPGERPAGGFAGEPAFGQQDDRGAVAEQVDGGGDSEDAAADDGDAFG